ncbi:nucleotide-binding protein, partial [Burkholderia pseudomallei]
LERCFGENTSAYQRFQSAAHVQGRPGVVGVNYPQRHHYQDGARAIIAQSIVVVESAQGTVQADWEVAGHEWAAPSASGG